VGEAHRETPTPTRDGVYGPLVTAPFVIELEPEVRLWWLPPDRRIVLLTVFRKTRMREETEVKRAKQAKALCEAEHGPAHDEFSRDFREEL